MKFSPTYGADTTEPHLLRFSHCSLLASSSLLCKAFWEDFPWDPANTNQARIKSSRCQYLLDYAVQIVAQAPFCCSTVLVCRAIHAPHGSSVPLLSCAWLHALSSSIGFNPCSIEIEGELELAGALPWSFKQLYCHLSTSSH